MKARASNLVKRTMVERSSPKRSNLRPSPVRRRPRRRFANTYDEPRMGGVRLASIGRVVMRNTRRSILALGAFFVVIAVVVAGCGSSGDVPSGSVAVVAGNQISTRAFDPWMYVAAGGGAAESPGQPVIVPEAPPNFSKCVAQVKAEIPSLRKAADKTLKADCSQL